MPAKIDMVGRTFGRLKVQGLCQERGPRGQRVFDCSCACGEQVQVRGDGLRSGNTRSCGCLLIDTRTKQRKEMVGNTYGRLTVIGIRGKTSHGGRRYMCVCACGSPHEASGAALRSGNTRSCGCLSIEKSRQRRGAMSPCWDPLLPDRERRRGRDWTLKQKVLDIHGPFCVICGEDYDDLHHLDNWKDYPEKRFDPYNIVPVCYYCHKDFHTEFGSRGTTLSDFMSYVTETPSYE